MVQEIDTGADEKIIFENGAYYGRARPQDSKKKLKEALEDDKEKK